ncbi:glucose-1-phosphate thymidylyltransferase [Alphaproteobacteria bacterium]|nr:glucose-1-phosphate thymidylyltransferase [Alphaproteobacteria bacterium]
MKGIILAGGSGTRLKPLTDIICKQLLPVYDKPMIHYPLATLINIGITDILIISTPIDIPYIKKTLSDGKKYGIKISYAIQDKPNGIAESFIIAKDFIKNDSVCLILGDNIFYGSIFNYNNFKLFYKDINKNKIEAMIFAYRVSDPQRYGVVELDTSGILAKTIEEKPLKPKSNWAVTGIYLYNNSVVKYAQNLNPSKRGELEITDINKIYLKRRKLAVVKLDRAVAWLDAGTHESLLEASNFVHTIEKRQGLKIACLEEVAFNNKLIGIKEIKDIIKDYSRDQNYQEYLKKIIN